MTNGSENMSVDAYRSFAEAQDDTNINNQLIINKKMKAIFKVTAQGEAYAVQSQKAEGGQLMKCNVVLQELGGKYENSYVAAILGEQARMKFEKDDIVVAALRFSTREYNGQVYQDIVVNEIVKLNK